MTAEAAEVNELTNGKARQGTGEVKVTPLVPLHGGAAGWCAWAQRWEVRPGNSKPGQYLLVCSPSAHPLRAEVCAPQRVTVGETYLGGSCL